MPNSKYNSTENMIIKVQHLKGKTKLKLYRNISNYYDNMKIRMDEDPFAKNAQNINKTYHEVLWLLKFLQTKPSFKSMKNNNFYFYYTVIKNRDEKDNKDNQFEKDCFNFYDIVPNHNMSIKPRETILRCRNLRS